MKRTNISSGVKRESILAYSRAVRIGPFVYGTETTATDEHGGIVGIDHAFAQEVQWLRTIKIAQQRCWKCVG